MKHPTHNDRQQWRKLENELRAQFLAQREEMIKRQLEENVRVRKAFKWNDTLQLKGASND